MIRKLLVPAVLSVAALALAVDSAQAQLRVRLTERRTTMQERRDMRRGVVRTPQTMQQTGVPAATQTSAPRTTQTGVPMQTGVPFTYEGPGYKTQSISNYYSPTPAVSATAAPATFRVILPDANAKLFVDGIATQQTGMERLFSTPVLQPGTYNYTIRAIYLVNGQERTHERTIQVGPGGTTVLDLTQR